MDGVYLTSQEKVDAILKNREVHPNNEQIGSEYLYEANTGSNPISAPDYCVNGDEYVLPPQERDSTPEFRPCKEKKGKVPDLYDEDHYNLARNSGFGEDFANAVVRNSTVMKNHPKQMKSK